MMKLQYLSLSLALHTAEVRNPYLMADIINEIEASILNIPFISVYAKPTHYEMALDDEDELEEKEMKKRNKLFSIHGNEIRELILEREIDENHKQYGPRGCRGYFDPMPIHAKKILIKKKAL